MKNRTMAMALGILTLGPLVALTLIFTQINEIIEWISYILVWSLAITLILAQGTQIIRISAMRSKK